MPRYLVAIGGMIGGIKLFLESMAVELDTREGTQEDQDNIRQLVEQQMNQIEAMLSGAPLRRPDPPIQP